MKKRMVTIFASILLFPLMGMARDVIPQVDANIHFGFYAAGKLLPAGDYAFRLLQDNSVNTMEVVNLKTGATVLQSIITNTGPDLSNAGEVVFDETGGKYFLTEVYIPGMEGVLLHAAPEPATHVKVKAGE